MNWKRCNRSKECVLPSVRTYLCMLVWAVCFSPHACVDFLCFIIYKYHINSLKKSSTALFTYSQVTGRYVLTVSPKKSPHFCLNLDFNAPLTAKKAPSGAALSKVSSTAGNIWRTLLMLLLFSQTSDSLQVLPSCMHFMHLKWMRRILKQTTKKHHKQGGK